MRSPPAVPLKLLGLDYQQKALERRAMLTAALAGSQAAQQVMQTPPAQTVGAPPPGMGDAPPLGQAPPIPGALAGPMAQTPPVGAPPLPLAARQATRHSTIHCC